MTPRHDGDVTIATSGTGWVVTDLDDVRYTFDSTGTLTGIAYRDGYTLTLAYVGGHNSSVTDTFRPPAHLHLCRQCARHDDRTRTAMCTATRLPPSRSAARWRA
ncbi:MAG: hypothetical protein WDN03_15545 [Rhizomicrobium sp.]